MERDKTQVFEIGDLGRGKRTEAAYLIVIAGKAIGKMFKLAGDEMIIGRTPDAHVLLDDEGVSRRHAKIERGADGGLRIVDLQSTNGIWFDGERVEERTLKDGDRFQIGSSTILRFSYQDALEEEFQQQLYDSATRDGLTRLYNKRFFLDRLEQEFSYSLRYQLPLSLVLLDIDHFKRINDSFGHPVGDRVLQELARRTAISLRTEDIYCRCGGEEFALIMRDAPADKGWLAGERLRRLVAAAPFSHDHGEVEVSVSVGVATFDGGNYESPAALIAEADRQLYGAKDNGRNRVGAAGRGRS